jgi:D-amino peptidase
VKILISADMEGVAGVTHAQQTRRDTSEFARSCELMTGEVRAACESALRAGATMVVVNDSHGDMRNIIHEQLPPEVQLIQGSVKELSMIEGIDGSFDALVFVGYHAPAATRAGILDHTYHGRVVHKVLLNGDVCSEARLNAAVAGTFGVPALFLSGDQSACADARRFLPWIVTATVKHALGRTAARALSPTAARAAIFNGIGEALAQIQQGAGQPYRLDPPISIDLTCMNSEMADSAALLPGADRIDGTTVRYVADNTVTAFRAFRVMMTLAAAV